MHLVLPLLLLLALGCGGSGNGEPSPLPPEDSILYVGQSDGTLARSIYRLDPVSGISTDLLVSQTRFLAESGKPEPFSPELPYPLPNPRGDTFAYLTRVGTSPEGDPIRRLVVRDAQTGDLDTRFPLTELPGLYRIYWVNDSSLIVAARHQVTGSDTLHWVDADALVPLSPDPSISLRYVGYASEANEIVCIASGDLALMGLGTNTAVIGISLGGSPSRTYLEPAPGDTIVDAVLNRFGERVAATVVHPEGPISIQSSAGPDSPILDISLPLGKDARNPIWRPGENSDQLLYALDYAENEVRLYLSDSDGANRIHITGAFDFRRTIENPRWSSSGQLLLLDYHYTDFDTGTDRNDLWSLDANSGVARNLTPSARIPGVKSFGQWHLAERWVLFLREDPTGASHIEILDTLDGTLWTIQSPEGVTPWYPLFLEENTLVYSP